MHRNAVKLDSIVRSLVASIFFLSAGSISLHAQVADDANVIVPVNSSTDARPEVDEKHPLYIPLQVAYKAADQIKDIRDYECQFSKRELIGRKLNKTTMKLKFREDPFSVYLKYLDNSPGREVLFVKGQNKNNLLVRETGLKSLVGAVSLAPNSPEVMAENKYPVTSIGLKQMLDLVIKQWEFEAKFGGITSQKRPDSKLPSGEICTVYEAIHEKPYKDFKFHTTRLWIDDKTGIAIGVQQLAFPAKAGGEPALVEEYFYSGLKSNLKLSDADFDKNNPTYSFR